MILGMSLAAFTYLHVAISLIGIAAGLVVVVGMIGGRRVPAVTALFLVTTVLTSVTGFLFPFKGLTPGIVVGILSLIVLLFAIVALYGRSLALRAQHDATGSGKDLAAAISIDPKIVERFKKIGVS